MTDPTHVLVSWPLGRRELMPLATYVALPRDALAQTRARLLTRREVIRMLATEVRR